MTLTLVMKDLEKGSFLQMAKTCADILTLAVIINNFTESMATEAMRAMNYLMTNHILIHLQTKKGDGVMVPSQIAVSLVSIVFIDSLKQKNNNFASRMEIFS